MTLKTLIDLVDELKPNAISNTVKTHWVNEAEGLVQTEVFLLAIEEIVSYTYATDQNTELLVEPPHDKLYIPYLAAQIDFYHKEYEDYMNAKAMFDEYFREFSAWYARTYRPADTHPPLY